jgi:hypothetical protein
VVPRSIGPGALDLGAALTAVPGRPANGDLFPLRAVGRAGAPMNPPSGGRGASPDGLGWRAGGPDGLRWAPATGSPGPTAGAGDAEAWTAQPWLSGGWADDGWSPRSWAAQQWLARAWAARKWATAGLGPAGWAALQWSWGGVLAGALDRPGLGGVVDLVARSWAARSWAGLDWTARSWASRR